MPKLHITDTAIAKLENPAEGQQLYWDHDLQGFGVRITVNKKVFVVQGKVDGRDRRVVVSECSKMTTQEARKLAKSKLGDIASGVDHNALKAEKIAEAKANQITLRVVFDDYLKSKDLRPKTVTLYTDALDRFFDDWKNKKMTDINREMARERFTEIMDTVAKASKNKRIIGNTSNHPGKAQASLAMRMLSSMFEYAQQKYEDGLKRAIVKENPVKALSLDNKGWRTVPRRQTVIRPGELRAFYNGISELKNDTPRDYLMFLMLTGLRRREASGLLWSEVDLKDKSITIPGERTKNKKPHGLPLSNYLASMLERRQKEQQSSVYVFPSRVGNGPLDDPSRAVASVRKHMGKTFSCHDCRRSFITIAEMLEIPPYTLQALLNHSSSSVTSGYVVSNIERLRTPMQQITDFMLQKMEVSKHD
jgi:integrase